MAGGEGETEAEVVKKHSSRCSFLKFESRYLPVKPSGPEFCLSGIFFLLLIQFQYWYLLFYTFYFSWFSLVRVYVTSNLSITSWFFILLVYSCSYCSLISVVLVIASFSFLILFIWSLFFS